MTKIEIFIQKAKLVHGDLYNYDETIIEGRKVSIICKTHGKF